MLFETIGEVPLVALIYGGAAAMWKYDSKIAHAYDCAVSEVCRGAQHICDYATDGVFELQGVRTVDSIGHVDESSIFSCGRPLIGTAIPAPRSRL